MHIRKLTPSWQLVTILCIAGTVRGYNLMWGNGYFFHPDEGNMARSVAQMVWGKYLYPDFFAYGQLPLYVSYLCSVVFGSVTTMIMERSFTNIPLVRLVTEPTVPAVTFPQAVYWLRFLSATVSVVTVWLVYKTARELLTARFPDFPDHVEHYAILTAGIAAVTPGLIQAAHFGTTESILAFVCMASVYASFRLVKLRMNHTYSPGLIKLLYTTGIVLGAGIASKITAVFFFLPVGLGLLFTTPFIKKSFRVLFTEWALLIALLLFLITVSASVFVIGSPFHILAFHNFRGTSQYETEVATGVAKVFYTRQFENTTPVLFAVQHIFPYALGLPLTIIGSIGFVMLLTSLFSRKIPYLTKSYCIILILMFGSFFLVNSFLYAKWTRFLTPIFPLFSLFAGYGLSHIRLKQPWQQHFFITLTVILLAIPGLKMASVYAREDVRIQASRWILDNMPDESYILSETANVVDIPLPVKDRNIDKHYRTISFNFYDLDENRKFQTELIDHLVKADYILVPSRRIFANHMRQPQQYPLANNYYRALFDGRLGFSPAAIVTTDGLYDCTEDQVVSFPPRFVQSRRGFCIVDKLAQQGTPIDLPEDMLLGDERAEESWTVFDHPVVRVYRKASPKTRDEYDKILDVVSL